MLERAERASHVDPPASSYAIMQRASPYCGENPEPGKDVYGELDPRPGIREHVDPPRNSFRTIRGRTLLTAVFDESAFWRSDESASPDTEVYRAILPSLSNR